LNPQENVWHFLRDNWLSNPHASPHSALMTSWGEWVG
jgi:hypothetical protein